MKLNGQITKVDEKDIIQKAINRAKEIVKRANIKL